MLTLPGVQIGCSFLPLAECLPLSMPIFRGAESDVTGTAHSQRRTAIGNSAYSSSAESLAAPFLWLSMCLVRKRLVEIQYFQTVISQEQREELGRLVQSTVQRIESADFLPHSGIRFPQNPCTSCRYVGLCLGRQDLAAATLVRRPGANDLGWLDELTY
jgi:hypothetical protein